VEKRLESQKTSKGNSEWVRETKRACQERSMQAGLETCFALLATTEVVISGLTVTRAIAKVTRQTTSAACSASDC
jgi:hypothetical protein